MKKPLSTLVLTTIAVSLSGAAFAISSEEAARDLLQRVQEKGTIYVGTEGVYPPFSYHDESGRLTGFDVEITRAVAKELGVEVDFKETQWDAMLAGLNNHRFDLVANQVGLDTGNRRAKYDKTDSYGYSTAVVVVRGDDQRIKDWSDLNGLKSGQSLTSNFGDLARAKGAEIIGAETLAQSILLVEQKRADLTINDRLAVLDYLQKHPQSHLQIVLQENIKPSGIGFVFNKGNEETIAIFNQALAKVRADGTLKAISEQFFGEDVTIKTQP